MDIITGGGVVVFPTRNLYGLGADAFDVKSVEKLFRIKKRPEKKPILLLVNASDAVFDLVGEVPGAAKKIMDAFWPGAVTIVFHAGLAIPGILTSGTGKIGIRMASHPVARALTEKLAHPLTGTSANISGRRSCADIARLDPEIGASVDLILDAGLLSGGAGSTIVDMTGEIPIILREGAISSQKLFKAIQDA